jgi:hypothetical protein
MFRPRLSTPAISLNGDFSDIVTYPPSAYKGIISIQLHNHPEVIPQMMDRLISYLASNSNQADFAGKLLLVELHRIRIRS